MAVNIKMHLFVCLLLCLDLAFVHCRKNRKGAVRVPRCKYIETFHGGEIIYFGDRKRWSLAFYICNDGSTLFPDNFEYSECTDDLEWEPAPPQCLPVYLIRVKTFDSCFSGTDANVYMYLHGRWGKTDRIKLSGTFETGDLDETRVMARDVGPITRVEVGHDGRGLFDDWQLEFVSIYAEGMKEYYVFRLDKPVWVYERDSVVLPRQENSTGILDGER